MKFQCLRVRRSRLGAALAALSLAVLLALSALWARSYVVTENFVTSHAFAAFDEGAGRYPVCSDNVILGSGSGVVGLTWIRIIVEGMGRAQAEETVRVIRREHDSILQRRLDDMVIAPHGEAVGAWHTLKWRWSFRTPGGPVPSSRGSAAAPYWVVMLPWVVPPVWWLWCPPGRALPRLTTRRLAAAVAAAALVAAGLAALWRASVTDRALDALDHLGGQAGYRKSVGPVPSEVVVGLTGYAVDDATLAAAHLDRLPDLRSLDLSDSRVTDAGLAGLAALTGLEELVLIGDIGITDAGLAHLRGLARLRKLDLRSTRVTPAGVARLRRALPHAEISD